MKKLMETHPPTFESSDEHSGAINNTPPIVNADAHVTAVIT
jgi:hypothetical protein